MNYTSMNDSDLLERYRIDNESHAFGELHQRHNATLQKFLTTACHTKEKDVADILQQVWTRVTDKIDLYDENWPVFNWLLKIAERVAVNYYEAQTSMKRGGKSPLYSLEDAPTGDIRPNITRDGRTGHAVVEPLSDLLREEQRQQVRDAVASLREVERRAFSLVYFQGMSHEEAAQELGIPCGSLTAQISRGRVKLRAKLAKAVA